MLLLPLIVDVILLKVAAGVGAAMGLTGLIGKLLFGVAPEDPLTFVRAT
jgi:hypothetical protein